MPILYYITTFIIIFTFTWFFIKQVFVTKFDPLYFLIYHSSLVVSSVFWLGDAVNILSIIQVAISHVFFVFGILCTWQYLTQNSRPLPLLDNISLLYIKNKKYFILIVNSALFLFFSLYLIKYLAYGFPLLTANSEIAKLEFSKGGLGFVSRIESAIFPIHCSLTFLLYYLGKQYRKYFYICLFIMFIGILSSGKSVLLTIFILYLIFLVYAKSVWNYAVKISFVKVAFLTAFILLSVLGVLLIGSENVEYALFLFVERITTASGLGLAVYLQNDSYFNAIVNSGPLTYLWNYLIVPVFAPMRLVEYEPTLARELGRYITGGDDFGPNPTVYLEGLFYFGKVVGLIYCFVIGGLISVLRYCAIRVARSGTISGFFLFVYIYLSILTLTTDFLVFMAQISSYLAFFLLTYFLARKVKILPDDRRYS